LEHHLYHLINKPDNEINKINLEKYILEFESNYKSKKTFDKLFIENNIEPLIEYNRFFEHPNKFIDIKNISNLYWKIYKPNK
jgi:hypothetical protein